MPQNFTRFIFTHQRKVRLSRCFYIFQCDCWHHDSHCMNGLYLLRYSIVSHILGSDTHCGHDTLIQGFQLKARYTLNWLWICLTRNWYVWLIIDWLSFESELKMYNKQFNQIGTRLSNPSPVIWFFKSEIKSILWLSDSDVAWCLL